MAWIKAIFFIMLVLGILYLQNALNAFGISINIIVIAVILSIFINHGLKWTGIFALGLIADLLAGTFSYYFLNLAILAFIIEIIFKKFSSSNRMAVFFCSIVGLIIYPLLNLPTAWITNHIFNHPLPVAASSSSWYNFLFYMIINTIILIVLLPNLKKFLPKEEYA